MLMIIAQSTNIPLFSFYQEAQSTLDTHANASFNVRPSPLNISSTSRVGISAPSQYRPPNPSKQVSAFLYGCVAVGGGVIIGEKSDRKVNGGGIKKGKGNRRKSIINCVKLHKQKK